MTAQKKYTDADAREFVYESGRRIYLDGGKDLGTAVPGVRTQDSSPWLPSVDSKYHHLARAMRDAGFVIEEYSDDRIVCMAPDRSHGFWVALRSDHWFIGNWAGHFYRGQDASKLTELCLLLLRNPPGVRTETVNCSEYPLPEAIANRFELTKLTYNEEEEERALRPGFDGHGVNRQMLSEQFGFRPHAASEQSNDPELGKVRALLESTKYNNVPIQLERLFSNDEFIFIPPWFFTVGGPIGFLFDRRNSQLHILGSGSPMPVGAEPFGERAVGAHIYIWAHYRGLGLPHEQRTGTVTITTVHKLEEAKALLRSEPHRCPAIGELKQQLLNPPCVVRGVHLWLMALLLFTAEQRRYFDFQITDLRTENVPSSIQPADGGERGQN